jgi:DNA-binding NtrC family response regulator
VAEPNDRRRHRRVSADLAVQLVDLESVVDLRSTNLSEGGLFVPTGEELPVGRKLALVVADGPGGEPIIVRGDVVRVAEPASAGGPGVAVAFREVPPRERDRLRKLMARADKAASVLLVCDDATDREHTAALLASRGIRVIGANPTKIETAAAGSASAVVLNASQGAAWLAATAQIRAACPDLPIVLVSADPGVAVAAARHGIFEVIPKPIATGDLVAALERALRPAEACAAGPAHARPVVPVTKSPAMRRLWEEIHHDAALDCPALIQGETGAGKGLVARWLHYLGPRRAGPFVAAELATYTPQLRDSELFGHVRGAFTDAVADRPGRVEMAEGGTLLLDEIGDLDERAQIRLLRLVEQRTFERVGESRTREFHGRILAATNKDLQELVRQGKFREDLYHRIAYLRIRVPPLRERREDLLELAYDLLSASCEKAGRPCPIIGEAVLAEMTAYAWPGNVRELDAALLRACTRSCGEDLASLSLPVDPAAVRPGSGGWFELHPTPEQRARFFERPLDERVQEFRDHWIRQALVTAEGDRQEAARLAGMATATMYSNCGRLGLNGPSDDALAAVGCAGELRVLVVDDQHDVARAHARALNRAGLTVEVAHSGHEVLDRVGRGERFDVILSDYLMPMMDGDTLRGRLQREHAEAMERCLFVLCTGQVLAVEQHGISPSPDASVPVLEKPLVCDQLLAIIQKRLTARAPSPVPASGAPLKEARPGAPRSC